MLDSGIVLWASINLSPITASGALERVLRLRNSEALWAWVTHARLMGLC